MRLLGEVTCRRSLRLLLGLTAASGVWLLAKLVAAAAVAENQGAAPPQPESSQAREDRLEAPPLPNQYPTYSSTRSRSSGGVARILCWVMTDPTTLLTKGAAVNNTWLKRCDVKLFISSAKHPDPAVISVSSQEGRLHLTTKTMKAFKYVYDHYFNDCDWFLKADDDTYVVVDNLRHMLSKYRPDEALYFGHHFKKYIKPRGYNSGGAGYVLSKQALFRYGEFGFDRPGICNIDGEHEDVEMGRCMYRLGVTLGDSRDEQGRHRFHGYSPAMHLGKALPNGYEDYDAHGNASGLDATSPYAITFHYVTPEEMIMLEYFTAHFKKALPKDLARAVR